MAYTLMVHSQLSAMSKQYEEYSSHQSLSPKGVQKNADVSSHFSE